MSKYIGNTQQAINAVTNYRRLPNIKKGQACCVDGRSGKVWGGNASANLNVLFDGASRASNCHPNYKMKIFNDVGEVVHSSDDC